MNRRIGCGCPIRAQSGDLRAPQVIDKAVGIFALTNVDDIVVLTLFFGQALAEPVHCESSQASTSASWASLPPPS